MLAVENFELCKVCLWKQEQDQSRDFMASLQWRATKATQVSALEFQAALNTNQTRPAAVNQVPERSRRPGKSPPASCLKTALARFFRWHAD